MNGANWVPNQWYGYTVINTNSGVFSVITANTANTIYYLGSSPTNSGVVACAVLTFNVGDTFQIRRVYASMDQIGRGSGDLLKDLGLGANQILVTINASTGVASWPNQVLEGVYAWGNTLGGVPTGLMSYYPTLQENRDFFNTPKPGYTPLVHPHPLQSLTYVGTSGTGGGTTQTNSTPPVTNPPPATNIIQPPSNLHKLTNTP